MRIFSTLFFLFGFILSIQAQSETEDYNPLNFWEGKWILKTTNIDPLPDNEEWKSDIGVNEFTFILNGNGLHRTVNQGGQQNESFFFWDEISAKIYTFSIYPDGIVWETSAKAAEGKRSYYLLEELKTSNHYRYNPSLKSLIRMKYILIRPLWN